MRERTPAGLALALLLPLACGGEPAPRAGGPAAGWPSVAGGPGGTRYTPLDEIHRDNVSRLEIAWEYHTGDLVDEETSWRNHSFQSTPILVGDALFFCTPRSRVISVDARSGAERWVHDPQIDLSIPRYNLNCRGVASWIDPAAEAAAACRRRIFAAAADARLLALDAETGHPCAGFGEGGEVDFSRGVGARSPEEHGAASPPTVVGNVVIVGSSVSENRRVEMPSGRVQAFDARTGRPRWSWDPIPRDPTDPARLTWEGNSADRTGAANVWSLVSADPARDLVFLPTSSPSPDWYGGERRGANLYADSVVALRASTGEFVWGFQTVHHDLWDYDVASQPVLIDWVEQGRREDGKPLPAAPGDRRAPGARGGAPGAPDPGPRRVDLADPALPGLAPSPGSPRPAAGGRLGPHRLGPLLVPRSHRAPAQRGDLHAPEPGGQRGLPGHGGGLQLGKPRL
jgi:quinoprotein glucose dehydrogenase